MYPVRTVTRRLLLRRFAIASPVCATFLLPSSADAVASSLLGRKPSHPHHPAAHKQAVQKAVPRPPAPSAPHPPGPSVMLDPGHGGKDPGAIGVSGTYEKSIALETALELKRLLEA